MTKRTVRPAAITAAAVLLVTAGLSACGSSSTSTSSTAASTAATTTASTTTAAANGASTVPVTLTEFKIAATPPSAPAGTVTFNVTNSGNVKHQLTLIKTNKPANTALAKQNPDDDISGAKGEISSIAPGATKTMTVKNLVAGHYVFVCALPGHYQSGMYSDFTVN